MLILVFDEDRYLFDDVVGFGPVKRFPLRLFHRLIILRFIINHIQKASEFNYIDLSDILRQKLLLIFIRILLLQVDLSTLLTNNLAQV